MVFTWNGILSIRPPLTKIKMSVLTSVSSLAWYFTVISLDSSGIILPVRGRISQAAGNLSLKILNMAGIRDWFLMEKNFTSGLHTNRSFISTIECLSMHLASFTTPVTLTTYSIPSVILIISLSSSYLNWLRICVTRLGLLSLSSLMVVSLLSLPGGGGGMNYLSSLMGRLAGRYVN